MAEQQHSTILYCTDFLNSLEKYPDNVVEWANKNPEYYKGVADGANEMFEAILHNQKCYKGFCYLRKDCKTSINGLDDPEYAAWRRRYYV